jgi:hypothetical protein
LLPLGNKLHVEAPLFSYIFEKPGFVDDERKWKRPLKPGRREYYEKSSVRP